MKAAVGDFDGEGFDDIAVLRIMLQYSERYGRDGFDYSNFVFGAFVDWYTFDNGSIKPKYNAHTTNYGDNSNGWVGIRETAIGRPMFRNIGISETNTSQPNQNRVRQVYYMEPITGQQIPYPVIERDFDIIAGKFSGQVGKVLPCDDLIIKYPQRASGNVNGVNLRSHAALMMNIPGVTNRTIQVQEITELQELNPSQERNFFISFAKDDYAFEGVSLGEPVKTTDTNIVEIT